MSVLYSNISPMLKPEGKKSVLDVFKESLADSDKFEAAVGLFSVKSLCKLNELVKENGVKDVRIVCGMYSVDGMPGSIRNEIERLHEEWQSQGIGEIYFVRNMDYHGNNVIKLRH